MTDFSYQLYSSRNFPPIDATLRMVAEAGYAQVEGYGGLFASDETIDALATSLAETGLVMPTAHFGFELLRDDPGRVIDIARVLGVRAVIVPYLQDQERDAADWAAFGTALAEAGKPVQDAGLDFGWHNHAFEFKDLGGEDLPLDLILAGSDDLRLELDLAWVQVAGQDPVAWIRKYGDRMIAAHIKDIAEPGECADEDGWADVGHGTMDWPALMGALGETRTEYFVMEHDNPSDDKRFADRSIATACAF